MSLIDGGSQLPIGLGMRLSMDLEAMTNFVHLSDDRKKQLIDYIGTSTTGDEAKNRITEVVNNLHHDSFQ